MVKDISKLIADYRYIAPVEMRWSDLDAMGHVNNAVYFTYLEQARALYCHESCNWDWANDGLILASAHIEYIAQLRYPAPAMAYVRTSRIGTKSLEMEYLIIPP
jgi:acyl-CoA thioester hydrolase